MRGCFRSERPVIESLVRLLLHLRRERHHRERHQLEQALRTARIHPYYPDKARSPPR